MRKKLGCLQKVYEDNEELKKQIEELKKSYNFTLDCRGDGNCFYRSIAVTFLERLLCSEGEKHKEMKNEYVIFHCVIFNLSDGCRIHPGGCNCRSH